MRAVWPAPCASIPAPSWSSIAATPTTPGSPRSIQHEIVVAFASTIHGDAAHVVRFGDTRPQQYQLVENVLVIDNLAWEMRDKEHRYFIEVHKPPHARGVCNIC